MAEFVIAVLVAAAEAETLSQARHTHTHTAMRVTQSNQGHTDAATGPKLDSPGPTLVTKTLYKPALSKSIGNEIRSPRRSTICPWDKKDRCC